MHRQGAILMFSGVLLSSAFATAAEDSRTGDPTDEAPAVRGSPVAADKAAV